MSVLVAVTGLISGFCSAGLIAVINSALHNTTIGRPLLVFGFFLCLFGKIGMNALSQRLLLGFGQETVLNLCQTLSRKIAAAPYSRLEKIGPARILTALTDDVLTLTSAIQAIPTMSINVAVVVGCSLYLAWLSWQAFIGMVVIGLLGALIYNFLHVRAFKAIFRAREERDVLRGHFRDLIEGIKELKMHKLRLEAFLLERILPTSKNFRKYNLTAGKQFILVDSWSQCLFYGIIGLVLFASPLFHRLSAEALTGFVFASLYVMSPILGIIGTVPTFYRGGISLNKIEEIGVSIGSEGDHSACRLTSSSVKARVLTMDSVEYTYSAENGQERTFHLGPIDLVLHPGEIVFLVGGNGSGKSTMVKVLSGLYVPSSGNIFLDEESIGEETREWYQQHFSVVFSDFYLFNEFLGLVQPNIDELAASYSKVLALDGKVSISNGKLSTTALSLGQRKRLALMTALLEDRPFYVFDEWAADQDPSYKETFYRQLLPGLKARGKAVLVVTHDDRYFDQGDRVIKLEEGRMVQYSGAISNSSTIQNIT